MSTKLFFACAITLIGALSLADGYAVKGDKEKAKTNYQKAFQMNPKFTASKEKMEKL